MTTAFRSFSGFSTHQLVEIATLAARSLLLEEKRQILFVELVEPLFPGNVL